MAVDLTFPGLADDHVVLRRWQEADLDQQLEAFGDPVFLTYSDWQPISRAEARQRLREQEQRRANGEQIDFAVVDRDDPQLVFGGASLNGVDERNRRASLGYWLAPAARGRGWQAVRFDSSLAGRSRRCSWRGSRSPAVPTTVGH